MQRGVGADAAGSGRPRSRRTARLNCKTWAILGTTLPRILGCSEAGLSATSPTKQCLLLYTLRLTWPLVFGFLVSLVASWTCPKPAGLRGLGSHCVCLPALFQPCRTRWRCFLPCAPPQDLSSCCRRAQTLWLDQELNVAPARQQGKPRAWVSQTLVNSIVFSKTSHLRPSFVPPWGGGKGLRL